MSGRCFLNKLGSCVGNPMGDRIGVITVFNMAFEYTSPSRFNIKYKPLIATNKFR
jgi:hypothetical protein